MLKFKNDGNNNIFYATVHSAGFDLCANEELIIPPGEWRLVGTGLRIIENMPAQTVTLESHALTVLPELQLRPRSGLAAKAGITLLNSPGTVDADYRGEIKINLINHSKVPFEIRCGERIAQAVCALVTQLPGIIVKEIERGEGGFGSTGQA